MSKFIVSTYIHLRRPTSARPRHAMRGRVHSERIGGCSGRSNVGCSADVLGGRGPEVESTAGAHFGSIGQIAQGAEKLSSGVYIARRGSQSFADELE